MKLAEIRNECALWPKIQVNAFQVKPQIGRKKKIHKFLRPNSADEAAKHVNDALGKTTEMKPNEQS